MGLFGPPDVAKMKAKRDVKGLIKALGYEKDAAIRKSAAEALGEIHDASAVEPLIAVLKDNDSGVRKTATEVLGKFADTRAVEPLIAVLKDNDSGVRKTATEVLGKFADARAVEPLIAVLKDNYWDVRKTAIKVLGEFADVRAVEPLVVLLKDSKGGVRKITAEALEKLGWRPEQKEEEIAYWVAKQNWQQAEALCNLRDVRGAKVLVDIYMDVVEESYYRDSETTRRRNYGSIMKFVSKVAQMDTWTIDHFVSALEGGGDKGIFELQNLIDHLDDSGINLLISVLKCEDRETRQWAIRRLEKIGWSPQKSTVDVRVAYFVALLEDDRLWKREPAAESLVALYHSDTLDVATKQLILDQRSKITARHQDHLKISSNDCSAHTDNGGIGIMFNP